MVLWVALFLLVVGISLILAFRSMRDFQQFPQEFSVEYGLFLIRRIENFNANTLDSIRKLISGQGLIISIERLFKGSQAALTIFGPKKILSRYSETLNLLELEDYTAHIDNKEIVIWEMVVKNQENLNLEDMSGIFQTLPELWEEDQFFWQLVVGANQTQIRAAVYSKDPARLKTLVPLFQNLKIDGLIKIPRPYSIENMMNFYRQRVLSRDNKGPILTSEGIMRLLRIS